MIRGIYYQRWWKNDRPECINKSKFIPSLAYSRAFIRVLQLIVFILSFIISNLFLNWIKLETKEKSFTNRGSVSL
jgi:hypothetical protein